MSETVHIGCKLPNGIILELPKDPSKKVELAGLNSIKVIGADHATTEVAKEFWDAWVSANKDFPALQSKAIFFARNGQEAAKIAAETKKMKTGFEKKSQKEMGVEPVSKDE